MKTTKSISIEKDLWKRSLLATEDGPSLSHIISALLEQWLNGNINLTITYGPLKKN